MAAPEVKGYSELIQDRTATATSTPAVSSMDNSKSPELGTELLLHSERPRKDRRRRSNPFDSTWTLVEEYVERYCSLPEFTSCPLLETLWECCRAVCEIKYDSDSTDLEFMENTWGELINPLNELCSMLYPHNRQVSHTHYRTETALSAGSDIPLEALRLAVTQLVKNTPSTMSGIEFDDVFERLQLVEQLWKLRELELLPGNCRDIWICKGRKFPTKHEAILNAIWRLLKAAFSAIEAHHDEAVLAKCGAFEKDVHFKIRRRREREAFEGCFKACEVLSTVVVDSIWCDSERVEDNETYLRLYCSRAPEIPIKPTDIEPDLPNSEDPHRRGMNKSVNEWNQGVDAAEYEPDIVDHSDIESTQSSSDASVEKGSLDSTMRQRVLPAEARKPDIDSCAAAIGATISSASKVVPPPKVMRWCDLVKCGGTIREGKSPQVVHNHATTSTQLPSNLPADTLQTHTTQASGGSTASNTQTQAPSNLTEQRPSTLPPKPPPPAAATPVPTPPSSSATPPTKVSTCTRCSTLDAADIEAIHHIRLRILLLHAATAKGYSSTSGRKFADFVREMPVTSFGDSKAQKKLFNTYRRAVLYTSDNLKGKGDTAAHEANVMQVKAAVEWRTQGGKFMYLRELYKQVVGVEVERMESLSEKSKATIMTG
ncbi:hypothetical protein L211DRAFT_139886 [Terfezia boudieri ATCC MYA-4762]|uniref:DUF7624 domain-containing protein n=1 Tax=Terfezia boudieri ATCC MYA-4762 TaxID=1051890 RepID=A0A3N4LQF9_9PEZI|nr:hypothetical protein L211DRAFT_139886 [Terfezia boudieri ATCC MYA-4762]